MKERGGGLRKEIEQREEGDEYRAGGRWRFERDKCSKGEDLKATNSLL